MEDKNPTQKNFEADIELLKNQRKEIKLKIISLQEEVQKYVEDKFLEINELKEQAKELKEIIKKTKKEKKK